MKIIVNNNPYIKNAKNATGRLEKLKLQSPGSTLKIMQLINSNPKNLAALKRPCKIKKGKLINIPQNNEYTKYKTGDNTIVNIFEPILVLIQKNKYNQFRQIQKIKLLQLM